MKLNEERLWSKVYQWWCQRPNFHSCQEENMEKSSFGWCKIIIIFWTDENIYDHFELQSCDKLKILVSNPSILENVVVLSTQLIKFGEVRFCIWISTFKQFKLFSTFGFINEFCETEKVASKDIPLIPTVTPPPTLIQPIEIYILLHHSAAGG